MKKLIVMLFFTAGLFNYCKAQPPNPSVNYDALKSRPIEDFYGLNGQNMLTKKTLFSKTDLRGNIAESNASYLRYPGGTVANYWDFQEGWFFRNIDDNGPISMDLDFQKRPRVGAGIYDPANTMTGLSETGGDYLRDFRDAIAAGGVKPLFVVNPLSSDKYYQLAMLLESKYCGLKPLRVEIGNEFYLGRAAYQDRFSNSAEYGNLVMTWQDLFKDYLGNDLGVGSVASNDDFTGSADTRRTNWNTPLYSTTSANLPDAFIIHQYHNSGLVPVVPVPTYVPDANDYQNFFGKINLDHLSLKAYIDELGGIGATTPIWMTEYNLYDRPIKPSDIPVRIHGTWYSGLLVAYETLKFLENNRIEGCDMHTLTGSFVFSNFFGSDEGFPDGDFRPPCSSMPSPSSVEYSRTSSGIAMEQIALALKGSTYAAPLVFSNLPHLDPLSDSPTSSPIYGWYFEKGSSTVPEIVIMNLGKVQVDNLDISSFTSGGVDEYVSVGIDNPELYANGQVSGNIYDMFDCTTPLPTPFHIDKTPQVIPTAGLINLPAFSITRIYSSHNFLSPELYAYRDTINDGDSTNITVLGSENYPVSWSTGSTDRYITVAPTSTTTYNATITLPDYSTVTKYITIEVVPSRFSVSINGPKDFCPGTEKKVSLEATAIGGFSSDYKYVWITSPVDDDFPDLNHGIGTTSVININPEVPTRYTVYATNGPLVAKASILVNVPTAIDVKPEYTFCINMGEVNIPVTIANSPEVIYTYDWHGSGHSIPTSNVINLPSVSTSESSILTIQATKGQCNVTKEVRINFFDCCTIPDAKLVLYPGYDLNKLIDANAALATPLPLTHVSNQNVKITCDPENSNIDILVHGDLHIRDEYIAEDDFNYGLELSGCNVRFSEGASITVEPGYEFLVDNTDMAAGCEKMWKGIFVDAATFKHDIGNNADMDVTISDAETAVNSLPGSTIDIRSCFFKNNVVGLQSMDVSSNDKNVQFITCFRSLFKTSALTLSPYAGQVELPGTIGLAGMRLKKVTETIGYSYAASFDRSNNFINLNSGIIAHNCTLTVLDSRFEEIKSDIFYNPEHHDYGAGIHADDFDDTKHTGYSYLKYDGRLNSSAGTVSMINCHIGVDAHNTELDVQNSKMQTMDYGVISSDNNETPIDILNNGEISASEICVALYRNDNSPHILVGNNNLYPSHTSPEPTAVGILVSENNNRKSDLLHCDILCNHIYMNYANKGIYLTHADKVFAIANYIIHREVDHSKTGLYAEASNNCRVIVNNIYSDPAGIGSNDAYYFNECTDNSIDHNISDNTRYGFKFDGSCSRTDFRQNKMFHHTVGLQIASGFIGPQTDKGNQWIGSFTSIAAENLSSSPASSLFKVNSTQGAVISPSVTPTTGWFDNTSVIITPETFVEPGCGRLFPPHERERLADSDSENPSQNNVLNESTLKKEGGEAGARIIYNLTPDRENNLLRFTGNINSGNPLFVKIYDLQGKIILSEFTDSNHSLHFDFPKNSFYLISITDDADRQSNFKLIW